MAQTIADHIRAEGQVSIQAAGAAAPEYDFVWTDLTLDAGGWVTGMAAHASTGKVMCRTDVGGVYALESSAPLASEWEWRWLSGSVRGKGAWSTQSLVADDCDDNGNTWLMAVGEPQENSTLDAYDGNGVYRTTDFGQTWTRVFDQDSFAGNGDDRHGGEALHLSKDCSTAWAAADRGLWRSSRRGDLGSWKRIDVPTAMFNTTAGTGLAAVATSTLPVYDARQKLVDEEIIWLVGDTTLAVSANDGKTWHNALLAGNATDLRIVGAERVVPCANGTTLFISAFVQVSNAGSAPAGAIRRERRRQSRLKARLFSSLESQLNAKPKPAKSLLVKLTLTAGGAGPFGFDWQWTQLSDRDDDLGLQRGSGGVDLVQLVDDERTLVAAYSDRSFGVSRDGGWTFDVKAQNLTAASAPGWWPGLETRATIPFGNGEFALVIQGSQDNSIESPRNNRTKQPKQTGWMLGTGFFAAVSFNEGDTWTAVTRGMGEVCAYVRERCIDLARALCQRLAVTSHSLSR